MNSITSSEPIAGESSDAQSEQPPVVDDSANYALPAHPWPRVSLHVLASWVLRATTADFFVEEELGFTPSGEGEHVFLLIEKRGLNTQQVAGQIARLANLPTKMVSYAGMKDRRAVTRQWFSVHIPKQTSIDWQSLNSEQLTLLQQTLHTRKLRRGVHKCNRFEITVSNIQPEQGDNFEQQLQQRLALIAQQGVPNYYGEQRFGRDGGNLISAYQMFTGEFKPKRHLRGIYLSSARSLLFNQILAMRVRQQSWNQALAGELLMLNGTQSIFNGADDPQINARIHSGDVHPTGLMAGQQGQKTPAEEIALLEQSICVRYPVFVQGLQRANIKAERRALRVIPEQLSGDIDGDRLTLRFTLPRGCFATAVLHELVSYEVSTANGSSS